MMRCTIRTRSHVEMKGRWGVVVGVDETRASSRPGKRNGKTTTADQLTDRPTRSRHTQCVFASHASGHSPDTASASASRRGGHKLGQPALDVALLLAGQSSAEVCAEGAAVRSR